MYNERFVRQKINKDSLVSVFILWNSVAIISYSLWKIIIFIVLFMKLIDLVYLCLIFGVTWK